MLLSLAVQGYQTFTQACGNLPLLEPRDAFLANLCEFALACAGESGAGETDLSPRGPPAAADKLASPRGSSLAAAGEAAEAGLVLAPKNVQSMRTLFNIAHRLSNVLGPAWGLVLETMNTLDKILHSPRTTTQARLVVDSQLELEQIRVLFSISVLAQLLMAPTSALLLRRFCETGCVGTPWAPALLAATDRRCSQLLLLLSLFPLQEVSAQSGEASMSSDLAILAAAASQLFECTHDMNREAVVSLLSGLRDVSMRHVPGSGTTVGQAPKLFALNRMVEVLLYNIGRIYDLWAIFLRCAAWAISWPAYLLACLFALTAHVCPGTAFQPCDGRSMGRDESAAHACGCGAHALPL
jgi:hypothetical protein